MAKKDTKPKTAAAGTNVRRISARDTDKKTPNTKTDKQTPVTPSPTEGTEVVAKRRSPLRATSDYFSGAWYELKQVRWPTRKATWGMTVALLIFTAFFAVLILLLDALFKYVFQLILG